MGMFDSVNVECPKCGELVEFQSKSGDCVLTTYQSYSVPQSIAEDLDGEVECCRNCGCEIELVHPFKAVTVSMSVNIK